MSKVNWGRGAWAVAAIMATGIASAAFAQQRTNDGASNSQPPATQANQRDWAQHRGQAMAGRANLDHYFVKVLIQADQDEIASARLAQQRSSNADVKKFAMQMVEDHTRLMNRLQQFRGTGHESSRGMRPADGSSSAAPVNRGGLVTQPHVGLQTTATAPQGQAEGTTPPNGSGTSTQPESNTAAATQPNAVAQGQADGQRVSGMRHNQAGMAGHHNAAHEFAAIMEEVANQTQQSLQRELSQKEGVQFDRCYLGQQVMAHMWLNDALTVFQRHASANLQPVLQEGQQIAQQHLTHAKALLARIEQSQPKSTALQQNERTNAR